MIYAFDTHYRENKANTVCIGFEKWEDKTFLWSKSLRTDIKSDYISGAFYKRELPCIIELLGQIDLKTDDIIVIDGFVFLDDQMKPGLGAHLYHEIGETNPIVGVGKSNFATLNKLKRPILRGESQNPLFITAIGLDLDDVANKVKNMFGEYRMPYLLSQLDQMTKKYE